MSADILRILVVLIGVGLVAVILIQQPKEGGMSAFTGGGGGASSTVFGAKGSGSFLFKLTAALALAFAISIAMLVQVTNSKDNGEVFASDAVKEEVTNDSSSNDKAVIPGEGKVKETPKTDIPPSAATATEKPTSH